MASGATDEAADRALSTVARKLDKTLSVEYTVNELITEASDPANLALMYIGQCALCMSSGRETYLTMIQDGLHTCKERRHDLLTTHA